MRNYALVNLDNDGEREFSVVCEPKRSLFRRDNDHPVYVEVVTGERIMPRYTDNNGLEHIPTGLSYSKNPTSLTNEQAYMLLSRIKGIGTYAYVEIIESIKNKLETKERQYTRK